MEKEVKGRVANESICNSDHELVNQTNGDQRASVVNTKQCTSDNTSINTNIPTKSERTVSDYDDANVEKLIEVQHSISNLANWFENTRKFETRRVRRERDARKNQNTNHVSNSDSPEVREKPDNNTIPVSVKKDNKQMSERTKVDELEKRNAELMMEIERLNLKRINEVEAHAREMCRINESALNVSKTHKEKEIKLTKKLNAFQSLCDDLIQRMDGMLKSEAKGVEHLHGIEYENEHLKNLLLRLCPRSIISGTPEERRMAQEFLERCSRQYDMETQAECEARRRLYSTPAYYSHSRATCEGQNNNIVGDGNSVDPQIVPCVRQMLPIPAIPSESRNRRGRCVRFDTQEPLQYDEARINPTRLDVCGNAPGYTPSNQSRGNRTRDDAQSDSVRTDCVASEVWECPFGECERPSDSFNASESTTPREAGASYTENPRNASECIREIRAARARFNEVYANARSYITGGPSSDGNTRSQSIDAQEREQPNTIRTSSAPLVVRGLGQSNEDRGHCGRSEKQENIQTDEAIANKAPSSKGETETYNRCMQQELERLEGHRQKLLESCTLFP